MYEVIINFHSTKTDNKKNHSVITVTQRVKTGACP